MTQPIYFTDPERLAETVIARVGKTVVLGLPLGIGKANHVANALYARAVADPSIKLRIFTALTLEKPHPRQDLERRFMAPVAERLFAGYPELEYGSAQRAGRLPANIEVNEFFFLAGSRLHSPSAQQSYVSANYTHALRYALDHGVNVFAQLVAKRQGEAGTRFSLSSNTDLGVELLQLRRAGAVDVLMVAQTNSDMPFMPGDADVGSDAFDFVLELAGDRFPVVCTAARAG